MPDYIAWVHMHNITPIYISYIIKTDTSCDETYCNNQGHCVNINGLTTCQCDHYFAGERCDLTGRSKDEVRDFVEQRAYRSFPSVDKDVRSNVTL